MRIIDVGELKEWVKNWFEKNRYYHPYSKTNNIPITELYDILKQMPTVDAVPVVRCVDCKHSSFDHYVDGNMPIWDCLYWDKLTDEDAYCSYGERKEE